MPNFNEWLEGLDQRRTVLVEVGFLNGGSSGTLRLSNRPFTTRPSDSPASVPFEDVILSGLTYGSKMSGQASGGFSLTVGSIVLAASPEVSAAILYQVAGQPVRVYLGDQRWPFADFQLVATLTAESLEPEGIETYRLNFRTERLTLDNKINSGTFTTGPNKDKSKPVLLGDCLNIKPVQQDDSGLVWAVSDGPVASIGNVRVDGVVTSVSRNTTAGTITFSSAPSGVVTCDAVGQGGGLLKDVVSAVLARNGITSINTAAVNALPAVTVGIYSEGDLAARPALDSLLRSVSGYWGFNRLGSFTAGLVYKPTGNPTASLTPDDILLNGVRFKSRIRPATYVELTFDVNHTDQSSKLGSVSAADRALWSGKGKTSKKDNAGILALYPDAEEKQATTVLRGTTAGEAEAERRRVFFSTPLRTFEVKAFAVPFAFNVGQEIRLFYPFFGMEAGIDAVVLSIEDDPLKGFTTLEVLVNG